MNLYAAPSEARPISLSPPLWLSVLAMLLITPIINGIGGVILGNARVNDAIVEAATYDSMYDPVVVRDGEVSAGPRLIQSVSGNTTLLVDPNETVALDAITTRDFLVVRRFELIRRQRYREEYYSVGDLQDMVSGQELVFDSAHISAWLHANRLACASVAGGLFALISAWNFFVLPIYAFIASLGIYPMYRADVRFGELFSLALLPSIATVALGWVSWSLGFPVGWFGVLVWPILVAICTALWVDARMSRMAQD